jgi:O-acetyl-ADP-ribose deacetylase (regulator of RNase III)
MNVCKGNIVTDNYRWILQQVNCKGVMAAGLAKQIREAFPFVYYDYEKALKYENAKLGHIVISHVSGINGREIISMLAQDGYGRDKRYTDYDAFKRCLDVAAEYINCHSYDHHPDWKVGIPYKIGCGLAGGNWKIIEPMLEEFASKVKFETWVVKLGG